MKRLNATLVLDDVNEISMICSLCRMTGGESYEKYGLQGDEEVSKTVTFENGVEARVRVVVADDEDGANYADCMFFGNDGELVFQSDAEDDFFGDGTFNWENDDEDVAYDLSVHARLDGEELSTREDIERKLAELDAKQAIKP